MLSFVGPTIKELVIMIIDKSNTNLKDLRLVYINVLIAQLDSI